MAKLYFYYSAMNAGKTTTLLQSNHNYHERGMDTLVYTPIIDDRAEPGVIKSRIGLSQRAIAFDDQFDLFLDIKSKRTPKLKCILVDEAQFLSKAQVHQLCRVVDELRFPVLTYGLRTDFLGHLFPGSEALLALSEEIIELKTVCHCGSKAIMNARIDGDGNMVGDGNQVEIGGNERYISLCRKHFNNGVTR